MVQNQTEILVKDNSGILLGRCISGGCSKVGARIQIAVLKAKIVTKRKILKHKALQDLLLIQTKKAILRNDGSTLQFNGNKGVCISMDSRGRVQLGFKRINTVVPHELRKSGNLNSGLSSLNLMKVANSLM